MYDLDEPKDVLKEIASISPIYFYERFKMAIPIWQKKYVYEGLGFNIWVFEELRMIDEFCIKT